MPIGVDFFFSFQTITQCVKASADKLIMTHPALCQGLSRRTNHDTPWWHAYKQLQRPRQDLGDVHVRVSIISAVTLEAKHESTSRGNNAPGGGVSLICTASHAFGCQTSIKHLTVVQNSNASLAYR